jgi:hypothetical protein
MRICSVSLMKLTSCDSLSQFQEDESEKLAKSPRILIPVFFVKLKNDLNKSANSQFLNFL